LTDSQRFTSIGSESVGADRLEQLVRT